MVKPLTDKQDGFQTGEYSMVGAEPLRSSRYGELVEALRRHAADNVPDWPITAGLLRMAADKLEAAGSEIEPIAGSAHAAVEKRIGELLKHHQIPREVVVLLNICSATLAGFETDALRYRWLRRDEEPVGADPWICRRAPGDVFTRWTGNDADAAVDASMLRAERPRQD